MPNVRAQRVSKGEIYIQASDGREWRITRAQLLALYQSQGGAGGAALRKQRTITALVNQIVTTLGAEQFDIADIFPDFDPADSNKAMALSIGGR